MEGLAHIKLAIQNGKDSVEDEVFGRLDVNNFSIDSMVEQSFHYYQNQPKKPLESKHHREISRWIQTALEYQGGRMNPLNQDIVQPEISIDIPIEADWAKFVYNIQGREISGQLCIKGTSDLLTRIDDNTWELTDYKSGKHRVNHKTNETKDLEYFQEKDFQLRLYHYSLSKMFPQVKDIIASIYYVNAGGVFTVNFGQDNLQKTEDMLREKFEQIRDTKVPELLSHYHGHFICKHCCDFSKPVKEGSPETWCQRIHRITKEKGIDYVIEKYKKPEFDLTHYQAPGAKDE